MGKSVVITGWKGSRGEKRGSMGMNSDGKRLEVVNTQYKIQMMY